MSWYYLPLLSLVVLIYPLVVLVCLLVVLVCPPVTLLGPLVVLIVLSFGLFITDLILQQN